MQQIDSPCHRTRNSIPRLEILDGLADRLDDARCIDSENGGPGLNEHPVGILFCIEWVQSYCFGADAYFVRARDGSWDGDLGELAFWGG